MSINLFRKFSNALKQTLPRLTSKTVPFKPQTRYIAAMDAVKTQEDEELVPNKARTRFRKRQWEFKTKQSEESEAKKPCENGEKFERIKKKKVVLLLGYCGVNYFGMQRNPGVATIEEELLKALLEAKYITEEDFKNQQNAQFQRSSRTDKGVSAARQVVSLKMPLEVNVDDINKHLPECIRVFAIKRVTNKFNSKTKCNARTYSYTLPTYVFEPNLKGFEEKKLYRISAEKLEKVNSVLGVYKGTKCYHNFTEKKHFQDPSASRFMMSFGVDKVFVENDMEFAVLLVKGQSFMMHQIRKMVGLVIAVIRGHAEYAILDRVFGKDKVMIPTAPGLGLVLDTVHYDRYDARYKTSHESLTWDDVEDTVQAFTHKYIYPTIVKGELEGDNMGQWLEKLNLHSYEPSEDEVTFDKSEKGIGGDDDEDDEKIIENNDNDNETLLTDVTETKSDNNSEIKDSNEMNDTVKCSDSSIENKETA